MSIYWNERIRNVEPYVPGEQPKEEGLIKLNTNENPYPPSPRALEAMRAALSGDMRLYPDPDAERLRGAVAAYYGVDPAEVFVGNGSDEVLALAFLAFFDRDKPVRFPDVTYSFYPVYANMFGVPYQLVELDSEFRLAADSFDGGQGGIVLANPNAPTGICVGLEQIDAWLAKHRDAVFVLDEAYVDFGGETAVPLVRKHPHLLVVQTLSKSRSLAGLRVGFAIGHRDLIEGLNRAKHSFNSYTLDRVALAGAEAALNDRDYFEQTRSRVIATRERTAAELRARGFRLTDSKANFLFASHPEYEADKLFRQLREKRVLVRYFAKPKIDGSLRISVGTDDQMDAFLAAVDDIMRR